MLATECVWKGRCACSYGVHVRVVLSLKGMLYVWSKNNNNNNNTTTKKCENAEMKMN